ncbi:MAG: PAS domain S-box protein [Actinoplanes sp.]
MFATDAVSPSAADRDRALHSTSLAFVRVDRTGLIRDWNPAAEELFGWSADEVVGLPLTDTIVPARLRSAHLAGFARRLAGDQETAQTIRVEVPARHRDGAELQVSMIIDGLDDGFCAFLTDRTESYLAQQELQRSSTLISAILEHTSAVISAKDLAGDLLFVNREYERTFQVAAADVVGRPETAVLPAAMAAASRARDTRVAESGEVLTSLEELPLGDDIRQYVVTRFPLTEPDGSVYGICSIAIDDTGRRRTEAALSASEKRFRDTVNNAPGMLFQYHVGPDGKASFTFVSDGCREIFGRDPAEALADATVITGQVAPEDRAGFESSVHQAVLTVQPWRWQGSFLRPDGELRWLHGVSRPQRRPDGSTVFDGVLFDRTDERRTELALAAGRQEVDEMTRRLAVAWFQAVVDPAGEIRLLSGDASLYAAVPDDAWAALRRGEPADVERDLDGRRRWIRLRLRGAGVVDGDCFDLARP